MSECVRLRTCGLVAQHRILVQEARVRYHGQSTTGGLKNNWGENAAFVMTPANG